MNVLNTEFIVQDHCQMEQVKEVFDMKLSIQTDRTTAGLNGYCTLKHISS